MKPYYVVHRGIGQPAVATFPCDTDRDDSAYVAACKVQDALNEEYRAGYRDAQRSAWQDGQIRWEASTPLRYVVTFVDEGWSYPTAHCETCGEIHTGACHNPEASDKYE